MLFFMSAEAELVAGAPPVIVSLYDIAGYHFLGWVNMVWDLTGFISHGKVKEKISLLEK